MAVVAADLAIINPAMVYLGATQVSTVSDTTPQAVAAVEIFEDSRDSLIQMYQWGFAIKRTSITENGTPPTFGRASAYDLPSDYLALLPPYEEDNVDYLRWTIENDQIITDDSSPLKVRYIAQITDPDAMHPLFKKSLSAMLAMELAEALTQSNSKKESATKMFGFWIDEAKKHGAIEQTNIQDPPSAWTYVRDRGVDNTKTWHG